MKLDGKYVIFKNNSVIVFAQMFNHAEMAAGRDVKSAGFIEIYATAENKLEVYCFGESISLGVKK